MKTTKTVFAIDVEIRNILGKIISNDAGHNSTGLKFEFEVMEGEHKYKELENKMRRFYKDLRIFLPFEKINISASVHNSIGGTWMEMAALYGEEDRFVIFT